ncbi:MAG: response regulator [Elusimicrobia bacterium]|nr:response regulator [Elusimicrobiota bacterium]
MGNKILIVDDDPDIPNALRGVLEPLGHQVEICANGQEALDTLQSYKPDLVIMDVMLPGIDGYSLVITISDSVGFNRLPIIVISGLDSSKVMFERFPQVAAFFTKPFHMDDFTEAVKTALAKKE